MLNEKLDKQRQRQKGERRYFQPTETSKDQDDFHLFLYLYLFSYGFIFSCSKLRPLNFKRFGILVFGHNSVWRVKRDEKP